MAVDTQAAKSNLVLIQGTLDDTKPLMTFGRKYDGTGGLWFRLY